MNLGRFMECQNCRSPKEADEEDEDVDPTTAQTVSDPALLDMANAGENWICEYCKGQVRNPEGKCVSGCGAPRSPVEQIIEIVKKETMEPIKYTGQGKTLPNLSMRKDPVPPLNLLRDMFSKKTLNEIKWPIFWCLLIGMVAGLFVHLFSSQSVQATVTGIDWTYNVILQKRSTLKGDGWGSPPGGAFNSICNNKYYGDKDCHPHDCNPHKERYSCRCEDYDCRCRDVKHKLKNGFSRVDTVCDTCQKCDTCSRTLYDTCYDRCPVYKDWCEYDYYKWDNDDSRTTRGTTHDVQWPSLQASGETQRLRKTEQYAVNFSWEKGSWTYHPVSLTDFSRFYVGEKWKLNIRTLGPNEVVKETESASPGR